MRRDKQIYEMHAEMCKVFTNPVRVEILNLLQDGRRSVNTLAELTGYNQPNISQHLTIMREKGIVTAEKVGNNVFYSLSNPKISEAFDIMKEILYEQLARNEQLAKELIPEREV